MTLSTVATIARRLFTFVLVAIAITAACYLPYSLFAAAPTVAPSLLAPAEPPHPIDRVLAPYFERHGIAVPQVVDDAHFARRAYFDCIGLLPTPAELQTFLDDQRPDKRAILVRDLLDDSEGYAQNWLTFWNDALRNDYQGTGYIDGGRKQITSWLYAALLDNMPFDQFVRALIDPTEQSEGFIKGIIWRGVVNASQTPQMQAAQNLSQVFLGINMKCASCHDSFINAWTLEDAYGLASAFAEKPLEIHHCDQPTGEYAAIKFLYPEFGAIDATASKAERVKQVAHLMTTPKNERFARTIVNRLWARLMGRGLIEPVDDMDARAWDDDLLNCLATDFVDHHYDVKHTLALILTSQAYQLPSVATSAVPEAEFVFQGPPARRLTAEQFADAVSQLTGVREETLATSAPLVAAYSRHLSHVRGLDRKNDSENHVRFASGPITTDAVDIDVDISGARTLGLIVVDADDGVGGDFAVWEQPQLITPAGTIELTTLDWKTATAGRKEVHADDSSTGNADRKAKSSAAVGIHTHPFSLITYDLPSGTMRFRARVGRDIARLRFKKTPRELQFFVVTDLNMRGALRNADSLLSALGRPARDQVVTSRSSTATTLQAIELTNGDVLDQILRRGADAIVSTHETTGSALIEMAFQKALGRRPTDDELATAAELIGQPPTVDGIADLLWAVTMLPEFQLIY